MDTCARVQILLILSFCYLFHCSLAANHPQNRLPSAVVVGTVYCDACFQKEFSRPIQFIPGASAAVECEDKATKLSFQKEVKTNRRGVFRVRLPLEISKDIKLIESCSVKLTGSNVPSCSVASSATSASLRLKSIRNGVHIFSAGFFTFRPLRQPELCNQKTNVGNQKLDHSQFSFKPFQVPPTTIFPLPPFGGGLPFPPNPFVPLPPGGGLPFPPLPFPPLPFPPNPFVPLPPGGGLPFPPLPFPPLPFPPNPFVQLPPGGGLPFPSNPFVPLPPGGGLPLPPNPFQPPLAPQPPPSLPPPPAVPQPSPAPN